MKHIDYKKELYSKSDVYVTIYMTKKEALILAQNLLQQANCDISEIEIPMALIQLKEKGDE